MVCMWRPEDNLQELVFFLCHLDSKDRTQVVRLGGKGLHQLSNLAGRLPSFLRQISHWDLRQA